MSDNPTQSEATDLVDDSVLVESNGDCSATAPMDLVFEFPERGTSLPATGW